MRAELPALLPGQAAVELPGDRKLGFAARQRSLELLAQRLPALVVSAGPATLEELTLIEQMHRVGGAKYSAAFAVIFTTEERARDLRRIREVFGEVPLP